MRIVKNNEDMTMPRPSEGRIHKISLRLTDEEYKEVKKNSEIGGMKHSAYVRKRILGYRIKSRLDLKMIGELRRLGGLLKLIHNESNGAYSEKTAALLKELQTFVKNLSEGKYRE
jgi:hypothetical protein